MDWYCPACDKVYTSQALLIEHLQKAQNEPEALNYQTHVEIYKMEGWDEVPLDPN